MPDRTSQLKKLWAVLSAVWYPGYCIYIALFYSLSTQSALHVNASDIYPFTHRRHWELLGVQCRNQEHFDTWSGGVDIELATLRFLNDLLNHYHPYIKATLMIDCTYSF